MSLEKCIILDSLVTNWPFSILTNKCFRFQRFAEKSPHQHHVAHHAVCSQVGIMPESHLQVKNRMYDICSWDFAPMVNANVKDISNPNPNPNRNLNPYPTPNKRPNHYPHSNYLLLEIIVCPAERRERARLAGKLTVWTRVLDPSKRSWTTTLPWIKNPFSIDNKISGYNLWRQNLACYEISTNKSNKCWIGDELK